jgi:thiol-disulfide isomerase/thioredoxin
MRARRLLTILAVTLAALLVLDMYFSRPGRHAMPEHLPDITLPTLEGGSYSIGRGDSLVTLLVYWATWCHPCIVEIPHLIEFHDKFADRGFRVVSINIDDPTGKKMPAFVERFGINYPLLIDADESSERKMGGILALPTSFLIDREGRVVRKLEGLYPPEVLEELITGLL